MRIERILKTNAAKFPSRILASSARGQLTYAQMYDRSVRLANALRGLGLERGSSLVVALPNRLEFAEAMFATAIADCTLVPVNPRVTSLELAYLIQDSGARAAILEYETAQSIVNGRQPWAEDVLIIAVDGPGTSRAFSSYEGLLQQASADWPGDQNRSGYETWLLAYTSGTTGRPKGVLLTHRAKYLCSIIEALEFGSSIRDVALLNTPMFHVHGLVHFLSLAVVGGSIHLAERFTPEGTLDLIQTEGISELSMVPTMYQALVNSPQLHKTDLSTLRIARCTGAQLSDELKFRILESFPGLELYTLYGATEAGPISNLRPEHQLNRKNSVGQPFLGVAIEVRASDGHLLPLGSEGEVFIKSPYVFSSYHGADEASPGGEYERWITLGDVGSLDSDGFLYLRGRTKDVIITGGENVAAKEVEDVLASHPYVQAVAVVGIPDAYWGERIKAFVELRPGKDVSEAQLLLHCERSLARYKHPKEIEIVPSLPRNAMGKIDKKRLAANGS